MSTFQYGIIEGFYGKQWSWQLRREYASFLAQHGFGFYLYAPKGDTYLRRQWQSPWPNKTFDELKALRNHYQQSNVDFGIGFSPLGLVESLNTENLARLSHKLDEINALNPDIFCLLFDDMPGDNPRLAQDQLTITDFVLARVKAKRVIVCPSYYSHDPVLEEVFGTMPKGYWPELGAALSKEVDVFWTGNHVISERIVLDDLRAITEKLQRPVFLWDNYPVNDGRKTSHFLHLLPFAHRELDRSHPDFADLCSGHASNPMNQGYLSQIPLLSLAQGYQGLPIDHAKNVLQLIDNPEFAMALIKDASDFQKNGRPHEKNQRNDYLSRYDGIHDPRAIEVSDWLKGHYEFDPECLTE